MSDLLFHHLGPVVGGSLVALSFVTSFITVTFGIGGGTILLAAMASLMPPAALIPVHGVVQLGSNALRAAVMIRRTHWAPVGAFALGALGGAALGGRVVIDLPPEWIRIGIGVFVIWSVWRKPPRWLGRLPLLTGLVTSVLTMFFGATGPFVATYVKTLNLPRETHVATLAVLMTLQHVLKSLVFGLLGFAFAPWLGFMALMIASGFLGTLTGRQVLRRMTDVNFKRALDVVLVVISLRLIWVGVSDLLR